MAAPTNPAKREKALANSEPSTHGTLRSLQNFSLSEWREEPGFAPKLLIADSLPALGASSAPAQCRRINLQPTYLDWQKWASVCRLHPTARQRTSYRT